METSFPPLPLETTMNEARPPLPPFTRETAIQKVRLAEDGWNSRDPHRVSLAYSPESRWRNRATSSRGASRSCSSSPPSGCASRSTG